MNQKLPYEKLIAEKMRELPVPDANASWQMMKNRLDEELPLESGSQKKPGGGWWWKGGLFALISTGIGVLIYSNARDGEGKMTAKQTLTEQTIPIAESKETKPAIDQNFTLSNTNPNDTKKIVESEKNTATLNEGTSFGNITQQTLRQQEQVLKSNAAKFKNTTSGQVLYSNNVPSGIQKQKDQPGSDVGSLSAIAEKNADDKNITNNHSTAADKETAEQLLSSGTADPQHNASEPAHVVTDQGNTVSSSTAIIPGAIMNNENNTVMAAVPDENFLYTNRHLLVAGDSIYVPATVWQLPDVTAQKKMILKEMRRQERKEERDLAKSYRSNKSFWGEQPDRWFAAGLAPYQNFSIGSQQTYNYNSANSKGIAADYIPAPYLQLHLTNKVYVLSEFQFNAPQSTSSLLLSQKQMTVPMNTVGYTESTYLRKLYYFNMPVSFYYSPVKNFYLGSGMQFSSFNSGLAYTEQRSANNSLLSSENIKIKDDSLSSKITSSEWRYLFDANYYVDRFMFGFRYNQALNNFVNLKGINSLAPVQARNQSFQFYIRYNIIMTDKRK